MSTELARYDAMCRAIEAAYRVDEVKDIRDKARALEIYAQQAQNVEAERRACEIRLRAERRAGELLRHTQKAAGAKGNPGGRGAKIVRLHRDTAQCEPAKLADMGISKKQSSDWQKLAAIPQKAFERALTESDRPTTIGIIKATEPYLIDGIVLAEGKKRTLLIPKDALWLHGRLCDFERRDVLSRDPSEMLKGATEEMLDDVHRLAPLLAKWLRRIGAANGQ